MVQVMLLQGLMFIYSYNFKNLFISEIAVMKNKYYHFLDTVIFIVEQRPYHRVGLQLSVCYNMGDRVCMPGGETDQ